jgi:glycosyltransferase involved in cell wall biosynthesis
MNESPLVSIISPAYNHERFITDCIESVLSQTYTNWEMIIIDDGSSDNTFSIARKYAEIDHRIKAFTQKNVGIFRLGESYNFALKQCIGKYIAILECDDVWFLNKLSMQVDALEKNPQCVLSWGKAYLSSVDLKTEYYLAPKNMEAMEFFYNKPKGTFLKEFLYSTVLPALTIVIRKNALLEIGGFQQGYNLPLVDIPTTIELLMKGEFAFINEPLGRWRIYPNQVTKTYTGSMTMSYFNFMKDFMNRFPDVFVEHNLSKKVIHKHFHGRLVVAYSRSGRYKLIRKDFAGARKDYWKSIIHFGFHEPVWKIRSVIGMLFSFFKLDVEWLAKLLGKDSYSQ